jgi:murein DD-endopeptidase MepM/ murein hydrolase activator NlpD
MGKLALFIAIIPFICFSNINKPDEPRYGTEKIQIVERQLVRITGDIDDLEKKLQDKNRKLLKNIEEKKKIEERLGQVKEVLEKNKETLSLQINEVKKYFQIAVLGEVGDQDLPSTLIGKKLLAKVLEDRIKILREIKFKVGELQGELINLQNRYNQFVQTENDLSQLLVELENRKKKLAENYYETQDKKDKLAISLNKARTQMNLQKNTIKNSSTEGFSTPLEDYFDVSFKNKGLTFKFKGLSQVFASKDGQVVYSGSLSTYGNVLMIDHGNNTRSVILGDIEISVKKGDKVRKGSIIGHTRNHSSKEGNLYFEVRNKDLVQNTISLMEPDFYQNHKTKKL